MYKKEELVRTEEYWMELIQNELYYALKQYMKEQNMNQTELAEQLGFSKGYISQVLHGNFNHSLKKLIALLLAIGHVPKFEFVAVDRYLQEGRPGPFRGEVVRLESAKRGKRKGAPDSDSLQM